MEVSTDTWLSQLMGCDVFRVNARGVVDPRAVREHSRARSGFYFAKVDTEAVATTKALLRLGFFIVDVNVTFSVRPKELADTRSPSVDIGALHPDRKDEVLAIAHDSFRYSRFHLDPLISTGIANAIKREWVRSYADGKRGDQLFVATRGGHAIGFLAARATSGGGPSATIDLIAVRADVQRQGVGRTLSSKFAEHYREFPELVVGTQVANTPSVRLYESMGFRLKSSRYVLHMHVRDGEPI